MLKILRRLFWKKRKAKPLPELMILIDVAKTGGGVEDKLPILNTLIREGYFPNTRRLLMDGKGFSGNAYVVSKQDNKWYYYHFGQYTQDKKFGSVSTVIAVFLNDHRNWVSNEMRGIYSHLKRLGLKPTKITVQKYIVVECSSIYNVPVNYHYLESLVDIIHENDNIT